MANARVVLAIPLTGFEEDTTMRHFFRLQLAGKVTYYIGWLALVCGGLVHFNIVTSPFVAFSINKRNLFELCIVSFLICIASELRVLTLPRNAQNDTPVKRRAAAPLAGGALF